MTEVGIREILHESADQIGQVDGYDVPDALRLFSDTGRQDLAVRDIQLPCKIVGKHDPREYKIGGYIIDNHVMIFIDREHAVQVETLRSGVEEGQPVLDPVLIHFQGYASNVWVEVY